jgi:threonine dehydrogenase-like Zn-dependent dehydrogenase
LTGGYAGGQAEWVRVPNAELNLLHVPEEIPDEKALYLSDVLPTSYHAVVSANVQPGNTVAVWGLGPIGFNVCMWAFKKGAARVIAIDGNWRTEWAKTKLPRLETINFQEDLNRTDSVSLKILEMVPHGVDIAIECSGGEYAKNWLNRIELATGLEQDTAEMVNECLVATRKHGTVAVIADYVGYVNHFNFGALMEKGITFKGCSQAPVQRYWKEILEMIKTGEVDPTMMLTHRFKLDDAAKVYHMQEKHTEGLVKSFLETRFSKPRAEGTPELSEAPSV